MTDTETTEIAQELHELNITQGKIKRLMKNWEQLTNEERVEEIQQCMNILQYPLERLGDSDGE